MVAPPNLPSHPWEEQLNDDFNTNTLNQHWQTLREPHEESWLSLSRRPGWLSLKGRNSLFSCFEQSLIARRLQHFQAEAETCLDFKPQHPKHEAGIIAYYDRINYHYLRLSYASEGQLKLGVVSSDNGKVSVLNIETFPMGKKVYLKLKNHHENLHFLWSLDGEKWTSVPKVFDSTNMGDWSSNISGFTGTFWGLCAQDMCGDGTWAEFEYFDYRPME
jgi:xylan 1,4-beta-xylosidase